MKSGAAILRSGTLTRVLHGKKELVDGGAFLPVCTERYTVNTVTNTIF